MFITLKHFALPQRGGVLVLAAACFAAGLTAGALIAPVGASNGLAAAAPERARSEAAALRGGHAAEVVRVLDGDTFEARVRIWPGMEVTTRVRLRGIDAPEMHALRGRTGEGDCRARRAGAILNEGTVGISRIGQDKYGGRVDADVSTAKNVRCVGGAA